MAHPAESTTKKLPPKGRPSAGWIGPDWQARGKNEPLSGSHSAFAKRAGINPALHLPGKRAVEDGPRHGAFHFGHPAVGQTGKGGCGDQTSQRRHRPRLLLVARPAKES